MQTCRKIARRQEMLLLGKIIKKEILQLRNLSVEWSKDLNRILFLRIHQLLGMISQFQERATCTTTRWTLRLRVAKKVKINQLRESALQVVHAREKLPLWQHSQSISSKLVIEFWMFLKLQPFWWKVVHWFKLQKWPFQMRSSFRFHWWNFRCSWKISSSRSRSPSMDPPSLFVIEVSWTDLLTVMRTFGRQFWMKLAGAPSSWETVDMKLFCIWLPLPMELTNFIPTQVIRQGMKKPRRQLSLTKDWLMLGSDTLISVSSKTLPKVSNTKSISV